MNTFFVFGSQYLRGLTPDRADWDRDMAAMRSLGFNTIRAWLVWGVLEPRRGEVDVDQVRAFLDLAHHHGLQVGLLFHLHGAPEWAIREHRDRWYVDEHGRSFEPAARPNTPSGGWPGLCFDHEDVQQLEAAFIRTIASAVGDHPALAFWEPINEPHQWIDFAQSPPGVFCYCSATRAVFIKWLQQKYGKLEALNEAWGRRLGDWDEVRPPTWRFGFSDWCDWRTFTAENMAGLVARRAEVIRACSPRPVLGHAWGGGCVTCSELGAMAFDDWCNARPLDGWGYSAFPGSAAATVLVGLGTASTRDAAQGKPFWQAELGSGDFAGGLIRRGRLPPQWLEMWSWESIRHGAKGLLYWQYRKERHGFESGAYGLTDYGGNATDSTRAVERIGRVLGAHADLFNSAQPVAAQVAILFSFQSYLMDWSQFRNCKLSVDALSGYFRMFWEESIPADIVHEDGITPESLRQYKVVVLPMPIALSRTARQAIKAYIEAGGTVLSDPYLCAYDPRKILDTEVPGDGFAEVFGCQEADIASPSGAPVSLTWNGAKGSVEKSHFQAYWTPREGTETLAVYEDGRPAILSHRWGRGRAVISGLNLGMSHAPREGLGDDVRNGGTASSGALAKRIVMDIAAQAGVASPLKAPAFVVASLLVGDDGQAVLIAINTSPEATAGAIRLPASTATQCRELLHDQTLYFADGEILLSFNGCETKVLLLKA